MRLGLPGLRSIDLSPLVQGFALQYLLGWDPVVGTSAKTHALVEVFHAAKVVQPVREKPISLGGDTGEIPGLLLQLYN